MVRRVTKRNKATLAKPYTRHSGKRYNVRGSGLRGWLKKTGKKIFKGVKKGARYAYKKKLLSKLLSAAAVVDKRALPAAGIAKALGLGKCTCKGRRVCKMCKQQYKLLDGGGLKPAGNGRRRRRRKVGAGLNP
jgi:hypothetical protein